MNKTVSRSGAGPAHPPKRERRDRPGSQRGGASGAPRGAEARRGDVRQRIYAAARRRIERFGYRKTTIEDIALDVGIAKGTVYLYFPGKEALVREIVEEILERLEARMRAVVAGDGAAAARLRRLLVERVLHLRGEHQRAPEGYAIIYAMEGRLFDETVRGHMCANEDIVAELVAEAIGAGEFAPVDAHETARALLVAFHALQQPRFLMRDRAELVRLASRLAELLVGGLAAGSSGRAPRKSRHSMCGPEAAAHGSRRAPRPAARKVRPVARGSGRAGRRQRQGRTR